MNHVLMILTSVTFLVSGLITAQTHASEAKKEPIKDEGATPPGYKLRVLNRCIDSSLKNLPTSRTKSKDLKLLGPKYSDINYEYSWIRYYGEDIDLSLSAEDARDRTSISDGEITVDDRRDGLSKIEVEVPIEKIFGRVSSKRKAIREANYEVTKLLMNFRFTLETLQEISCKESNYLTCADHRVFKGNKKSIDATRTAAFEYFYNAPDRDPVCLTVWKSVKAERITIGNTNPAQRGGN